MNNNSKSYEINKDYALNILVSIKKIYNKKLK